MSLISASFPTLSTVFLITVVLAILVAITPPVAGNALEAGAGAALEHGAGELKSPAW